MPQIVDIYCRTTTEDAETAIKLQGQERICRIYCEAHSLVVGMVHAEVASDATLNNRTALRVMQERYRTGIISGVVIYRIDCLARDYAVAHTFVLDIYQAGVYLHCANPTSKTLYRAWLHSEGLEV